MEQITSIALPFPLFLFLKKQPQAIPNYSIREEIIVRNLYESINYLIATSLHLYFAVKWVVYA